jgi:hypothetical protein
MKTPRLLSRWGLVSLNGHGPYLAGYEVGQGTRTSTPLLELDPDLGTALTSSGRPYFFNGEPDPDYGLATALDVWGQYFGLAKSTIRSLNVDEAAAMITANGNTPYNRTIEEENALRRKYGVPEVADESEILRVSDVPDLIAPDPDPEEIESYESFGRGNVFRDLGVDNPEERSAKADVASAIATLIDDLHLSTERVVELTGLTSRQVFWIVGRGDAEGVSLERLEEIQAVREAYGTGRKP